MLKRLRNDKGVKRYIDTMDDIQYCARTVGGLRAYVW